jgi:transposase-like protein
VNPRNDDEKIVSPAQCPSCRSREITTTAKAVDKNTNWRCVTCGEVWNLGRREASRSHNNFPSYGGFRR